MFGQFSLPYQSLLSKKMIIFVELIIKIITMKKISITLLLLSFITVEMLGATAPIQKKAQKYMDAAHEALMRKDYDEVMRNADKFAQIHGSYEPLKDIAEQLDKEATELYPNDKKAFVKPMQCAAKMGNPHALHAMGIQYCAGRFVPKDEAKGLALIKASEKLGYGPAKETYYKLKTTFDNVAAANNRALKEQQRRYDQQITKAMTVGAVVAITAGLIAYSYSKSGGGGGSSYSYRGSADDSDEAEKAEAKVDIENIGMPQYEWASDWYKNKILPFNLETKNEAGENQVRKIRFNDASTGKIYRVFGNEAYWSSKKKYKTLDDAIIAEYVYQKYGKIREKGRW